MRAFAPKDEEKEVQDINHHETRYTVGAVIKLYPSNELVQIVDAGSQGVRYIDPMNLVFDERGHIVTKFKTNVRLSKKQQIVGHITLLASQE